MGPSTSASAFQPRLPRRGSGFVSGADESTFGTEGVQQSLCCHSFVAALIIALDAIGSIGLSQYGQTKETPIGNLLGLFLLTPFIGKVTQEKPWCRTARSYGDGAHRTAL